MQQSSEKPKIHAVGFVYSFPMCQEPLKHKTTHKLLTVIFYQWLNRWWWPTTGMEKLYCTYETVSLMNTENR